MNSLPYKGRRLNARLKFADRPKDKQTDLEQNISHYFHLQMQHKRKQCSHDIKTDLYLTLTCEPTFRRPCQGRAVS